MITKGDVHLDIGLDYLKTNDWGKYVPKKEDMVSVEKTTDFEVEEKTEKTKLDYYKEICKAFPNVAFVVVENTLPVEGAWIPEIQKEFRGISDISNFSDMSTVSIELDVKLLEKIQEDPDYMETVMNSIKWVVDNYDIYREMAMRSGVMYLDVQIFENVNGKIGITATAGEAPFEFFRRSNEDMQEESKDIFIKNMLRKLSMQKNEGLFAMMDEIQKNSEEAERLLKKREEDDFTEQNIEKYLETYA